MEWIGPEDRSKGVLERQFQLECDGRQVPGLLFRPEAPAKGLVLVGHGASNDKRTDYIGALSRNLVRRHDLAAAVIDGPMHGDRRETPASDDINQAFGRAWHARPEMTAEMTADWIATLDALQRLDGIGEAPVGYWGLSMGTIFGLPFVVREPRIVAATLGLMGFIGPTPDEMSRDAARLQCPLLFLVQWNDEIIPRDQALRLFDEIATGQKTLHANPGAHAQVPAAEFAASQAFLAKHLARAGRRASG